MEDRELIEVAVQEIAQPTFASVIQFLEIHELIYHDGKPEIAGVRIIQAEQEAIVYFSVKDATFHFALYLNIEPDIEVRWADTEDFCRVYFNAWSETMYLQQLIDLTKLKPTDSYDIGDRIGLHHDSIAQQSGVEFNLNSEPGATEQKLKELLDFLEQDAAGIKRLADEANGSIQVYTVFHNGNTMLGGIHLDKEDIQRLAALNLEVDFDLYAEGNKF